MTAWVEPGRVLVARTAILGLVPVVLAHGGGDVDMVTNKTMGQYPPSYFTHPDLTGWIYGHVGLMVAAWVFMLPVCT